MIANNYKIRVLINANPESRLRVEEGEYCLRLNENKVDINRYFFISIIIYIFYRNYDVHWEHIVDEVS